MMKKQISKITIAASLLVATMVNAQEFYTCVPKKSWWSDVMMESVEKGVRKGQRQGWNHITTIDFTKIINDRNLHENNLPILNTFLSPGTYRFKLNLKHKNGTILDVFENKLHLNKNGYLFQGSIYIYWSNYFYNLQPFLKSQNYDKVIFVQNRNLKDLDRNDKYSAIGIKNIKINDIVLFSWESFYNDNKQSYIIDDGSTSHYYHSSNIFKYSTLEIYKEAED